MEELNKNGSLITIIKENNSHENTIVERVNGVLKDEYFLNYTNFNLSNSLTILIIIYLLYL